MPEPKRVARSAALDDISDHLAVVLKRADELLAEWSAFGATVRSQVEREAATIGDAVANSVDGAVARATAVGIDRAISDHVGARLNALTGELSRLEARARGAARSLSEERTGDRRILWVVVAGVLLANALLVVMLMRKPATVTPVAEPTRVEYVTPPVQNPVGEGSAVVPASDPVPGVPDPKAAPAGTPSKTDPKADPAGTPSKTDPKAAPAGAPSKTDSKAAPAGASKVDSKAAPAGASSAPDPKAVPAKTPGGAVPKTAPGGAVQAKPTSADATQVPIENASAPAVRVPTGNAKLPPRRK